MHSAIEAPFHVQVQSSANPTFQAPTSSVTPQASKAETFHDGICITQHELEQSSPEVRPKPLRLGLYTDILTLTVLGALKIGSTLARWRTWLRSQPKPLCVASRNENAQKDVRLIKQTPTVGTRQRRPQ
jgi:hypothetical protein